jgi:REP element-mobilizing transposase RayT
MTRSFCEKGNNDGTPDSGTGGRGELPRHRQGEQSAESLPRGCGRLEFLELFGEISKKFDWGTHAYCLMGNHFHIAVRTEEPNLPSGMRELMGRFARWHNRSYRRSGHLFGGRYRAQLIRNDGQLLAVARYIVRNPVAAGLVGDPQEWAWSSYRATLGLVRAQEFLRPEVVLGLMHRRDAHSRVLFRAFVETPQASDARSGDTADFDVPVPSLRPSARSILAAVGADLGVRASLALGHSHADVAEALGVSRSAVSHRLSGN